MINGFDLDPIKIEDLYDLGTKDVYRLYELIKEVEENGTYQDAMSVISFLSNEIQGKYYALGMRMVGYQQPLSVKYKPYVIYVCGPGFKEEDKMLCFFYFGAYGALFKVATITQMSVIFALGCKKIVIPREKFIGYSGADDTYIKNLPNDGIIKEEEKFVYEFLDL